MLNGFLHVIGEVVTKGINAALVGGLESIIESLILTYKRHYLHYPLTMAVKTKFLSTLSESI